MLLCLIYSDSKARKLGLLMALCTLVYILDLCKSLFCCTFVLSPTNAPDMKRIVILSVLLLWGQIIVAKPRPINKTKLPQRGKASFYSNHYSGRKTSNAELYDPNQLTAAHESLALGTKVKVTNLKNGKQVIVKINDRCACSKHGRVIDLSKSAAMELDFIQQGVARVEISPVN